MTYEGGVQPGLSGVKLLGFPGKDLFWTDLPLNCPPLPSHCPKSELQSLHRPLTPKRLEEGVPSPLRGPRVNSPEGASWGAVTGRRHPETSAQWRPNTPGSPEAQKQGEACFPLDATF